MTDLQSAKAEFIECLEQDLCDECSERHGASCPMSNAVLDAYEAEVRQSRHSVEHAALLHSWLDDADWTAACQRGVTLVIEHFAIELGKDAVKAEAERIEYVRLYETANERVEESQAEAARLRAMLEDAARFVNPFRLASDRPHSAETTAEVLAELERRETARSDP